MGYCKQAESVRETCSKDPANNYLYETNNDKKRKIPAVFIRQLTHDERTESPTQEEAWGEHVDFPFSGAVEVEVNL